jgi:K+-transporting ATPase c subunit
MPVAAVTSILVMLALIIVRWFVVPNQLSVIATVVLAAEANGFLLKEVSLDKPSKP